MQRPDTHHPASDARYSAEETSAITIEIGGIETLLAFCVKQKTIRQTYWYWLFWHCPICHNEHWIDVDIRNFIDDADAWESIRYGMMFTEILKGNGTPLANITHNVSLIEGMSQGMNYVFELRKVGEILNNVGVEKVLSVWMGDE